jgi:hypothetical protein
MRKLLRGGQVSLTRAFADNNVERVLLHSSLHADAVSHSVSSASLPKPFKLAERFRNGGRPGASIRASNYDASHHREHFATLGLSAAASKQEIKHAYRKLALQVLSPLPSCTSCVPGLSSFCRNPNPITPR